MTTTRSTPPDAAALDLSMERVLAAATSGKIGADALASAAAFRTIAAWTLAPAPLDPCAHVRAAHVEARPYLARVARHASDVEVASVMTADLFRRLTRRPAATPATTPATTDDGPPATTPADARYTYTPRKVLRRVLDHALDHLNQIDQWKAWQRDGITPDPTDGWASSIVTLPEDLVPLTGADLDAWLWRIDQAIRLLAQRAAGLGEAQLDWRPPDGGWSLRRVIHHVSRCERLYATALEEAPAPDPLDRYREAGRLLEERADLARRRGADPAIVYVNLYGVVYTPEEAAAEVVSLEEALV